MRVLVVGGAGYVGSHSVKDLCAHGHSAVVLDNLCSGHRQAVDPGAEFVEGDLGDRALLDRVFGSAKFDAVMHFAAFLDVNESTRLPLKYYRNNVANTGTLLEAMHDAGVRRFVFSSTCATYGVADSPISEDAAQNPITAYGRTKRAVEWMLEDCAGAWGLGATALRYFNASGAAADGSIGEDHHPEIHLIPLVLQVASGTRAGIKLFGTDYPTPDGTCIRDYIHVEDLAAAHRLALESQAEGDYRYYNLGTGIGTSVKELVEAARQVTGHAIPAVPAPRREGDPPELFANPAKAKAELGWTPEYTQIERIVETAWQWHRSHPNGYADGDVRQ